MPSTGRRLEFCSTGRQVSKQPPSRAPAALLMASPSPLASKETHLPGRRVGVRISCPLSWAGLFLGFRKEHQSVGFNREAPVNS